MTGYYVARSPVPIISCQIAMSYLAEFQQTNELSLGETMLLAFHLVDHDLTHDVVCAAESGPAAVGNLLTYFQTLVSP